MSNDPYGFNAAANSGGGSNGGGNGGGNQGKSGGSKALMYVGIFALVAAAALVKNHDHLSLDMFSKSKHKPAVSSHVLATTPLFPTTTTTTTTTTTMTTTEPPPAYVPPPTTAENKTYYGGIMYHVNGDDLIALVYRNYSSSTELVNEMEKDNPDYGYTTISSGECAAVVYGYPLPGFPVSSGMWGSGRGSTEKSATSAALKEVNWWSDNTKVVKTYCQD